MAALSAGHIGLGVALEKSRGPAVAPAAGGAGISPDGGSWGGLHPQACRPCPRAGGRMPVPQSVGPGLNSPT